MSLAFLILLTLIFLTLMIIAIVAIIKLRSSQCPETETYQQAYNILRAIVIITAALAGITILIIIFRFIFFS